MVGESVLLCYDFVAPRDAIKHGAVVGSMETNDERGDPGSLNKKKKKNIGSHFIPSTL